MADIKTTCPRCHQRYLVTEDFFGERVECTKCGRSFAILSLSVPERTLHLHDAMEREQSSLVVNGIVRTFVRIEPGALLMGNANGNGEEKPAHKVRITRSFWMSCCPITQIEYWNVMESNPSYHETRTAPVECVTWHEAVDFCERLTERERNSGRMTDKETIRLPTEAEWEYAARTSPTADGNAGNHLDAAHLPLYCFGNDVADLPEYAWFQENSDGQVHEVQTRKPSPRGLYDLHGNVGEWCADWYARYRPNDQVNPSGPPIGRLKVRRGGSWESTGYRCRATDRLGADPTVRSALLGFRVVLSRV